MSSLPILLYHSINDDPPEWIAPYTVTSRAFAEQLDAVVASGRTVVTADAVVAALRGGPPLPDHAVALTFDDGFRDFERTALPLLAERSLPATLFVTTGALAPLNRSVLPPAAMLTLGQVSALARSGVGIGAHSHLHEQLDTLARPAALRELARPKLILENALGREVGLFAYPHGFNDARVRQMTQEAGYRGAFAVRNAFSAEVDDAFRIARLTVRAATSRARIKAWLAGTGAPTASTHDAVRTVAWRFYRQHRAKMRETIDA